MRRHNKNVILISTAMIILYITVTGIITYLSRYCTFYGDDMTHSLYQNSMFESLNPFNFHSAFGLHGGGYICFFLTNFFNYNLPHLLNIHPADFMSIPNGIIKGLLTCIIFTLITSFGFIFRNSKYSLCLIFTVISMYFIYSVTKTNSYIIGFNHSFYRYIFPLLFFGYFWYFIYKCIITPNSILKPDDSSPTKIYRSLKLFTAVLSGFIIGTSCEIIFSVSALTSIFIILYNICFSALQKFTGKSNLKKYKYNLDYNFYIPVCSLFISVFLFTTSPGFKKIALERGSAQIHITLEELKEFSGIFIQQYISNEIISWIIFCILLIISISLTLKKHSVKKILFPVFLQLAVLLTIFSLILCGKTYYEPGKFWLIHPNITVLYRILILYGILILYSITEKYFALLKPLQKTKSGLSIILLFSAVFFIPMINNSIKTSYWYNDYGILSKTKKTNYITEKIFRFYYLQNKTPYLPIELSQIEMPFREYFIWNRDCIKTNDNCCTRSILTTEYLPKMYSDKRTINYKYCFSENAIEKFYQDGGSFTNTELNNIKFNPVPQINANPSAPFGCTSPKPESKVPPERIKELFPKFI